MVSARTCEGRIFDVASSAPTMFSNRHIFRSPGLAIGETRDDGVQVLEGKGEFWTGTDVGDRA